jgi:glycine amidinotransferase
MVGRSYPPQFYDYIDNTRVRNVMERIAIETEEDYQKLISLLESFDVRILRPHLKNSIEHYKMENGIYSSPPMTPRDYTGMFGEKFYASKDERFKETFKNIYEEKNKILWNKDINTASITRVGKDLYFGTYSNEDINDTSVIARTKLFPNHRCHIVDSKGHTDGTFCPVVPGLIISLCDIQRYEKTFPNWEVIYLPEQSWDAVEPFLQLKTKNYGKWWVPGEELNNDFTDFVEHWLGHWVGYVEESVFDVNMLVIDKKNVVCNNYNKAVFDAFERHGITPHIVNFRHRYFWDGGLHCITSDIDREGVLEDYFPERGEP